MRLDAALVARGLCTGRDHAKELICARRVTVDGTVADRPAFSVDDGARLAVLDAESEYVSRGGRKLERALDVFGVELLGKVCADAGAAAGGFTDCMLRRGAAKVYAIDAGTGQLSELLRRDARVVSMEQTNIRTVTSESLGGPVDFCAADLSFISLSLVLPVLRGLLRDGGRAVCLVKPQFEAGRGRVGKNGVVRDAGTHIDVLTAFLGYAARSGFTVTALTHSPIRGPEGNIEFLACLDLPGEGKAAVGPEEIPAVVREAHRALEPRKRGRPAV